MLEQGELGLKHTSSDWKRNSAEGEGPSSTAGQQHKNLRKNQDSERNVHVVL